MRYAKMVQESYVDGPDGPRTVLWVQGCSLHCPGCQNPELWSPTGGQEMDPFELARVLLDLAGDRPITISGGEPMDQIIELRLLVWAIRNAAARHDRDILVYTGYTWEELTMDGHWAMANADGRLALLGNITTLVDGRYDAGLDHDGMQWRGSSNQRVIDCMASMNAGAYADSSRLVLRDWDSSQEIQIAHDGSIVGTGAAIAKVLADLGATASRLRCGAFGEVT